MAIAETVRCSPCDSKRLNTALTNLAKARRVKAELQKLQQKPYPKPLKKPQAPNRLSMLDLEPQHAFGVSGQIALAYKTGEWT